MSNESYGDHISPSTDLSFTATVYSAVRLMQSLLSLEEELRAVSALCCKALESGHKILACGNGGSACEAQHLTGELMGRYRNDRPGLPAIALNADSILLTCIGNDFSFEDLFARQVQALAVPGDVLAVFTTSGSSPNVLNVLSTARRMGIESIVFVGREGGAAIGLADYCLLVPHGDTARIQEAHQFLLHSLMDNIERHTGHLRVGK